MLAFHPVKMQCCYEKVEQLSLEGLQQRFDVTSPSVFVQRAQILMREVSLVQLHGDPVVMVPWESAFIHSALNSSYFGNVIKVTDLKCLHCIS